MPQLKDLSRSLTSFIRDKTLVADIELSLWNWLIAVVVPGLFNAAVLPSLDPSCHTCGVKLALKIHKGGARPAFIAGSRVKGVAP